MHLPDKISVKPIRGFRLKTFSVLSALSLFTIAETFSQVSDDFSDGDFTTSPSWDGTTANFLINASSQLQLNATVAGTSWLTTSFSGEQLLDVEWEFYVKESFAPSGANYSRFYLVSDQPDLSAPLNGYYVQLGEAGSGDAVELFRQTGTASVSVCRASPAAISTSFAIRVRVVRTRGGLWQLYADYAGGTTFGLEASGTDATHTRSQYCGILCTYTVTNATRFYFDEIAVRDIVVPDTTAPRILSAEALSAESLQLRFSEDVEEASARDILNYRVASSGANPASVTLRNSKIADLVFERSFQNGYRDTLHVDRIRDLAGNAIASAEVPFFYFRPHAAERKDVILTEIFPDPSPAVALPEVEFVEVLNRSPHPLDLSGWTFSDESTSGTLDSAILLPGDYMILTSPAAVATFSSFGHVRPVHPFPTLNNSGDIITLRDRDGRVIDSLKYSLSSYVDEEKSGGGWSIELIDPENVCAEEGNWVAAEDASGGTPGRINSVFAIKPDNTGPRLLSAFPIDSVLLLISFNEKLEQSLPLPDQFTIDPPLGLRAIALGDPSPKSLKLLLQDAIKSSETYTITVRDIFDCPGNEIQERFATTTFLMPGIAEPGDVLVNEILFNPRPTGVDFVEIYNRSEKTINLRDWSLRNFEAGSEKIFNANHLIGPGEYRVFTEDGTILKGEYISGVEQMFVTTAIPSFNDDEGYAALVDEQGIVIDSMHYSEALHTPFVNDPSGVSLERISILPRSDQFNWRSASSSSGFATPGYMNSNLRHDVLVDDGSVIVEPEVIQTHASARDFAQIKYRFEEGGFMGNVTIFDPRGHTVKNVARNELLGTEGFFRWDGDLDNGSPARTGYYMVWFEVFDAQGSVKTYRKRVVVY